MHLPPCLSLSACLFTLRRLFGSQVESGKADASYVDLVESFYPGGYGKDIEKILNRRSAGHDSDSEDEEPEKERKKKKDKDKDKDKGAVVVYSEKEKKKKKDKSKDKDKSKKKEKHRSKSSK